MKQSPLLLLFDSRWCGGATRLHDPRWGLGPTLMVRGSEQSVSRQTGPKPGSGKGSDERDRLLVAQAQLDGGEFFAKSLGQGLATDGLVPLVDQLGFGEPVHSETCSAAVILAGPVIGCHCTFSNRSGPSHTMDTVRQRADHTSGPGRTLTRGQRRVCYPTP